MNSDQEVMIWEGVEQPKWFGRITVAELEKLAGIGFTPERIAMYYRVKLSEFMYYFTLPASPLKYHYDRGQLMQQAAEGIQMADAAATGDNTTQAQRFDRLRREVQFRDNVNKVFFDDLEI